jgi:hypothetical protein
LDIPASFYEFWKFALFFGIYLFIFRILEKEKRFRLVGRLSARVDDTGSPLGEVRLGVRDEHYRGGDHSAGNARERAAHCDGGTA